MVTCDLGLVVVGLASRRGAIAQMKRVLPARVTRLVTLSAPVACRFPRWGARKAPSERGHLMARDLQSGRTGRRAGLGRSQTNPPARRGIMFNRILFSTLAAAGLLTAAPAVAADAQHDHGGSGCSCAHHAAAPASQVIAEGTIQNGVRTVEMQVTEDGYVPAKIRANKGEKLRLVVTRTTDRTCAKEIVIKEAGINTPLPLGKAVTIEVSPKKSGELKYACGMDMISGVILVP
jgi:hypothetical protein